MTCQNKLKSVAYKKVLQYEDLHEYCTQVPPHQIGPWRCDLKKDINMRIRPNIKYFSTPAPSLTKWYYDKGTGYLRPQYASNLRVSATSKTDGAIILLWDDTGSIQSFNYNTKTKQFILRGTSLALSVVGLTSIALLDSSERVYNKWIIKKDTNGLNLIELLDSNSKPSSYYLNIDYKYVDQCNIDTDGLFTSSGLSGDLNWGGTRYAKWINDTTANLSQECTPTDLFKRQCCAGKLENAEDRKYCTTEFCGTSTNCDNLVGNYCKGNTTDPICGCHNAYIEEKNSPEFKAWLKKSEIRIPKECYVTCDPDTAYIPSTLKPCELCLTVAELNATGGGSINAGKVTIEQSCNRNGNGNGTPIIKIWEILLIIGIIGFFGSILLIMMVVLLRKSTQK